MHVVNYDILKLSCAPLKKSSGTFLHQEDVDLKSLLFQHCKSDFERFTPSLNLKKEK